MYWYTSVIPAIRRLRQNHKYKVSLGYIVRSCGRKEGKEGGEEGGREEEWKGRRDGKKKKETTYFVGC